MALATTRLARRIAAHRLFVTAAVSLDHTNLSLSALYQQHKGNCGTRKFSVLSQRAKSVDPEALMKTLPPKPEPPSNDDCCLSGCEYCVWDLYDEDMREYKKYATQAREAFEAQGKSVPEQLRPENLHDLVDPSMRAFLDMEREMAMRIQQEEDEDNNDRDLPQ
ncbi:hypothetical protein GGI25_001778 [Coemansia spiralis]|uniref:Oxidoreductase-like domain-containing protein n=2 Tax=Coemansia TaxID=4863 RepID=A0A9W8GA60_9FUNG|nr:hypothetical protein EDC05_003968 [Coemansia umbellata]KAJ2624882.1 hypothetical protein GGI26_000994 [Coemansia sp. RSA 1358]KAJ2679210.1 hypothetical protein GGI25_001778 [Coemansia spiralis]